MLLAAKRCTTRMVAAIAVIMAMLAVPSFVSASDAAAADAKLEVEAKSGDSNLMVSTGTSPMPGFNYGAPGSGGAGHSLPCPVFLNPSASWYNNGVGSQRVSWTHLPEMATPMKVTYLDSSFNETGNPQSFANTAQLVIIDVINSDWDPYPAGYALPPSYPTFGPHYIQGRVGIINWELQIGYYCTNIMGINALPPPMSVANSGDWVEGGTGFVDFHQKFPLTIDNTYPTHVHAGVSCLPWGPFTWCGGSTAHNPQDYTGLWPAPDYAGDRVEFAAHSQDAAEPVQFTDDICKESTENIFMAWVYEIDLVTWGSYGAYLWTGLLGNETASFDIADDDWQICDHHTPSRD